MSALNPKRSERLSPLASLQDLLQDDMAQVNDCILQYMESDVPMIPELAGYLISAGGKRVRPLLTLAGAALYGGDMNRAYRLSASVEFIHTATLLHDDVVDDSVARRGNPSANTIYGNEASVLVGDFLFSRAFQLMVADGSLETLKILSDASAIIAEGEVLQLTTQGNLDTTLADYNRVIAGKTAALFAAACEVGPVIAGADSAAMRSYGHAIGMAFQMTDDVLDYAGQGDKIGKTIGDDFAEGKMSMPVIIALENADAAERQFWNRVMVDQGVEQEKGDLEQAIEILKRHDALEKSLDHAIQFSDQACAALKDVPDHPLKQILNDLAQYVVQRGS